MAFDLLLAPEISKFDWLMLWVISFFVSGPISNFMVEKEYKQQLEARSCLANNMAMGDISRDGFKRLAQFLAKREKDLKRTWHSFIREVMPGKVMFR
jgi:hypothetical protein